MEVSGVLQSPAALPPGKAPRTHSTVGPKIGEESRRYTDWAIPTPGMISSQVI
jgi:hypothetical protein